MKVLVVDADTTISEGVATALQLQWHDATILTATTGDAGLASSVAAHTMPMAPLARRRSSR